MECILGAILALFAGYLFTKGDPDRAEWKKGDKRKWWWIY